LIPGELAFSATVLSLASHLCLALFVNISVVKPTNTMSVEPNKSKRTIWNCIWYPTEVDFIRFKVFQMVAIPALLIITVVLSIATKSSFWTYITLPILAVVVLLSLVATFRFKIISPTRDRENS
jgi:hypothetical protein